MRPTFSIIFFTVMSGAGYGLWILTSLGTLFVWPEFHLGHDQNGARVNMYLWPDAFWYGIIAGFFLVSAGLLSSLGHLGKPGRAWRAFSQWRSSWLSREGVAAVATFLPVGFLAIAWIHDTWQVRRNPHLPLDAWSPWLTTSATLASGIWLLAGALTTIYCTANIYACLKPIRAWHNRYVVSSYLLLGIYSGGICAWVLAAMPGGRIRDLDSLLLVVIALACAGAILKFLYWRFLDRDSMSSTGDATGLASLGAVRSFEQPHTEENYLTHEMGFRVARKHSRSLRLIALIAGFATPGILALLALLAPKFGFAVAWLSLASGLLGIFVERWLFFAEARHTVMLYYGAHGTDSPT